jgi:hypothetical protein
VDFDLEQSTAARGSVTRQRAGMWTRAAAAGGQFVDAGDAALAFLELDRGGGELGLGERQVAAAWKFSSPAASCAYRRCLPVYAQE